MDKIIVVDKPKGLTSHQVVAQYRKKLNFKKIGHAGTLDPFATGVLLILVGQATKKFEDLLDLEKEYVMEVSLGWQTDTGDLDGRIIKKTSREKINKLDLNRKEIEQLLDSFLGKYIQAVPKYSATKYKGKPLYYYARQGKKAVSPKREVEIKEIKLLKLVKTTIYPRLTIKVVCSSGTYMRSLAEDIGRKLGVAAVATKLKRTRVGKYKLKSG